MIEWQHINAHAYTCVLTTVLEYRQYTYRSCHVRKAIELVVNNIPRQQTIELDTREFLNYFNGNSIVVSTGYAHGNQINQCNEC
jgi:hypothetical protein